MDEGERVKKGEGRECREGGWVIEGGNEKREEREEGRMEMEMERGKEEGEKRREEGGVSKRVVDTKAKKKS
ncbi:hypothetical protein K457DRAFT_140029, partial [Linnemannia elongata AG-77]